MSDVRTHPAYAALAEAIAAKTPPADVELAYEVAMRVGQDLFLAAWQIALLHPQVAAPALVSTIIDAAWALAAAHAEDEVVLGETAGILIGVEERLTQSADSIRRLYYPEWRRLLAEQGAAKGM